MSDRGAKIVNLAQEMLSNIALENARPANRYERVEIDALVFYAARQLHVSEELIRSELRDVALVQQTPELTVADYHRARAYLWLRLKDDVA